MSKDSKKPAIRFKGFTDDWEQRKCGDVMKESRIPGHSGDVAKKITVKLWGKGVFKKDDIGSSNTQYFVRKEGQFIYSKLDFLNSAFGVIPKELDSYETTADLPAFDCVCVNPYFMFYRAIQPNFYYEYGIIADGSRKAKRIHADVFLNMPLKLPSIEEQNKITKFLLQLENLITLHQRKLDKLKNIKKALLEKMFPRNGENIPEVRFKGFSDDWEQRKLGDLAEIVGGGTPSTSKDEYWDGEIDWYAPAEIANQIYVESSERKITSEGLNNSSAKMLPVGTVLFTSRAGIGKMAILRKEACTNQGFQSIVPHVNELDSYFIFSRSEELKRYGETVGAGSTFVEVSGKQMSAMPLMMPPTIDEQRKIGEYFSSLDNLITLHQRKLDKLKNIKKALLEKMFV